jgi:hypothetical protein
MLMTNLDGSVVGKLLNGHKLIIDVKLNKKYCTKCGVCGWLDDFLMMIMVINDEKKEKLNF